MTVGMMMMEIIYETLAKFRVQVVAFSSLPINCVQLCCAALQIGRSIHLAGHAKVAPTRGCHRGPSQGSEGHNQVKMDAPALSLSLGEAPRGSLSFLHLPPPALITWAHTRGVLGMEANTCLVPFRSCTTCPSCESPRVCHCLLVPASS